MTSNLLPDELWDLIQPQLPRPKKSRKGGRPRLDDRRAMIGILVVLRFAIPWKALPKELNCGSGSTCRRRLIEWQRKGVWERVWKLLLNTLGKEDGIDMRRVSVDVSNVPAKKGAKRWVRTPRIAEEMGQNTISRSMLGVPVAVALSPANVHDSRMMIPVLDAITPIQGPRGRPRSKPGKLHADKGYDYPRCRQALRDRRIVDRIARRGIESKKHMGRHRWVVERTFAWLKAFRRLQIRYERIEAIHRTFLVIGCIMICWRALDVGF